MSSLPVVRGPAPDPLALLEQGRAALERAVSVDEAMRWRGLAAVAEEAARQAKLGREAENLAAELRVRAERKAGELLAASERNAGGRPPETPAIVTEVSGPPTLSDIGVTQNQSKRFQRLAAVPAPDFEEYVAATREAGARITSSGARMAVHYSSQTDQWATPQDLFDQLDAEFRFTLDVCASAANAKCARFFSEADDGLTHEWTGTCWMNPPYGSAIAAWVQKAYESAAAGATIVCLVPARVDTAWWWDHCRHGEVRFLRGRLKFGNGDTSAPFPSAVVIFGRPARVVWWER